MLSTDFFVLKLRHRRSGEALPRLGAVTVVFLSIYWITNQLSQLRTDVGTWVFAWERHIPFVDWTIIPYASIVVFFCASFFVCRNRAELNRHVARLLTVVLIAAACYLVCPLRFTFDRPVVEGLLGAMFSALTALDLPYNRAPSLHIAVLVILWLPFARALRGAWRTAMTMWFVLIGISVLTTYQHHVVDIPAGLAAGLFCLWLFPTAARSLRTERSTRFVRPIGWSL